MGTIYKLNAGYTLTVTAGDGKTAHARQVEDPTIGAVVTSSQTFGPYYIDTHFNVTGESTVAMAVDQSLEIGTAAAKDTGFFTQSATLATLFISTEGVPEDATQAALTVNPTGDDNGLIFTAVAYGAGGNDISIEYVDPSANDAELSVSVVGSAITVSLATGEAGAITSTAADVLAAIEASAAADALVTVAIMTADSGSGDDGSGVVTAMALDNLTGGEGTGIGTALPGCLCIDYDNGDVYRNSGSTAVPAWTQLADVA
jgi:hypothetical protein